MELPPPLPGSPPDGGHPAVRPPAGPGPFRVFSAGLLSFYAVLFVSDGALSLLDEAFSLALGGSPVAGIRGLVAVTSLLLTFLVLAWMSVSTLVPKRFFLPLGIFQAVALLGGLPFLAGGFAGAHFVGLGLAFLQTVLGGVIFTRMAGGMHWRWPVLAPSQLGVRAFAWRNLLVFNGLSVLLTFPTLAYLGYCGALAVDHFSDQFVVLHGDRLSMRAKTFVRADGKTVHLVPMVHIGQASFYEEITRDLPEGSLTLLEGVTDHHGRSHERLSYERVANTLGLAAQVNEFALPKSRAISADLDLADFSPVTLEFLSLMSGFHSGAWSSGGFRAMVEKAQQPGVEAILLEDILTRRNAHLLKVLQKELLTSDVLVVPWGAAHMPGLARGVAELGFQLRETKEYPIIHYRTVLEKIRADFRPPAGG